MVYVERNKIMKKLYTVGLVFTPDLEQVLLMHKEKPDWQVGFLNGMGGKVEDGESVVECITRECLEETCLSIPVDDWVQFATIINDGGRSPDLAQIEFFTAIYSSQTSDAKKGDYEEVEWFSVADLPNNCMQNLYFMIPMARETLRGHNSKSITVVY